MSVSILPRIYGTEMEYGVDPSVVIGTEVVLEHLPKGLFSIGSFLSNGSRLYADMHHKLEYATPECPGAIITAHSEFSGEDIILQTFHNLFAANKLPIYPIRKCVIDDLGNTWGYHENYLMKRSVYENKQHVPFLAAHLASRSALVGAGKLAWSEDGPYIVPAQKIKDIEEMFGSSSTSNKSLINTKDEPHAPRDRWARQHIVCGDANISIRSTILKLGSTSLVLRLAETRTGNSKDITLEDPLGAAHSFGEYDSNLELRSEMTNGKRQRAIDVQEALLEQCEKLDTLFELPEDEKLTLQLWRQDLDTTRYYPDSDEARQTNEFLAKKQFTTRFVDRNEGKGLSRDKIAEKLEDAMQGWDNIDPKISIGRRWMELDSEELLNPEMINELTYFAPQGTRAQKRGKFIFENHRQKHYLGNDMNWTNGYVGSRTFTADKPR